MIKQDAYNRWEKFKECFKENPKEFNIFDVMSLRKSENGELFYQMNIFHRLVEFQCAFVSIVVSPEEWDQLIQKDCYFGENIALLRSFETTQSYLDEYIKKEIEDPNIQRIVIRTNNRTETHFMDDTKFIIFDGPHIPLNVKYYLRKEDVL